MKFLMILAEESGNQGVHCPILYFKQRCASYKERNIFFSESIMGCVLTKNQCIDHPRDPFKTVASVSLVGELNTDIGITLLLRI